MLNNPFKALDDEAVEAGLFRLARNERAGGADIILHLLVVKERKLYVPAGCDSIFAYCRDKLGFSRATSYRRKVLVERAEEFPELVERLRDGRLQLCAAATLAPHLTAESAAELLDAAVGLSHREVETLLLKRESARAALVPLAVAPAGGLKLEEGPFASAPVAADEGSTTSSLGLSPHEDSSPKPIGPRTVVKPLTATSCRVNMTLHEETLARFKRAKEILGGKSDDEILARAFDILLDQIAPERRHARRAARQAKKAAQAAAAKAKSPRAKKPKTTSRRGSAADRDEAMVKAGSQCCFVGKDGMRCQARAFIQHDHDQPWAMGGASDAKNLQPMCWQHNNYLAERTFGPWTGREKPNLNTDA